MKATDNAFPIHAENRAGYLHFGLEVRDYIAIQAMVGMLSNPDRTTNADTVACIAYEYADAMLKQSEVRDE